MHVRADLENEKEATNPQTLGHKWIALGEKKVSTWGFTGQSPVDFPQSVWCRH